MMGSVISKWKKKKTTVEILEGIDKDILKLQKFRKSNQELRSRIIGNLILYSIIIYVIACAALYFLFIPTTVFERVLQILPFLCFPILIYLLKRFLHWWFVRKLSKNELELQELKDERKDILENVMETETYKKAKEILEKFDPETKRKLEEERQRRETPSSPQQTPGSELRRRNTGPVSPTGPRPMFQASGTPMVTPVRSMMNTATLPMPNPQSPINGVGRGQRMPFPQSLPRPLIRQNRSAMEKMVEYFVGDGPNNRYALICKNCYSHNGMALREEFEYMEYRCAYCSFFNTARKQRPNAPRLPARVRSPMVKRNVDKTQQRENLNADESEATSSSTELQQTETEQATNNEHSDAEEKDSKQFSHGDTTSVADLQQGEEVQGNDEGDHEGEQEKREIDEDFPEDS